MRRLLLLAWLLLTVMAPSAAQPFTCDETPTPYTDTLNLTYTSEGGPAVITVLGVADADPLVYNVIDADFGVCTYETPESAAYEVRLPETGAVGPSPLGVVEYLQGLDAENLRLAEADGRPAQFVVLVEQFPGSGTLTLDVTDALRAADLPLTAYLLGLPGAADLTLQAGAVSGKPLTDPDAIQVMTPLEVFEGTTGQGAVIPVETLNEADSLQIVSGSPSTDTVLALHFGLAGTVPRIPAQVEVTDTGTRLTCDGARVADNALSLPVTPDMRGQTLTVLGQADFDPVIALVTAEEAVCYPDAPVTATRADLPTLTIDSALYSARVSLPPDAQQVVIAGREDGVGDVLLMFEGALSSEQNTALYALTITPGLRAAGVAPVAYMIARDDALNPYLGYVDADGMPIVDEEGRVIACDDAGINSLCWGETVGLRDFGLQLDGVPAPGLQADAMLRVPAALNADPHAYFNVATTTGFGSYLFLLHLVTL